MIFMPLPDDCLTDFLIFYVCFVFFYVCFVVSMYVLFLFLPLCHWMESDIVSFIRMYESLK